MGKRIILFSASLIVVILALAFFVTLAPWTFESGKGQNDNDYSSILSSVFAGKPNTRAVDIAMLGAHDAFSYKIDTKSKVDPAEEGIAKNTFARIFAGGLIARNAKAQKDDTATMLQKGVRYFDVRISHTADGFQTKHTLIHGALKDEVLQLLAFLQENPGEFVIFDIQHMYLGEKSWADFWAELETYTVEGKSLFDYVYRENGTLAPLDSLTYGQLTENGQDAGVIILAKDYESGNSYVYPYDASILSVWHSTIKEDVLREGMLAQKEEILTDFASFSGILRVNQAQMTPLTDNVVKGIFSWSLLLIAQNSNKIVLDLIEQDQEILKAMPIVMVDYATSNKDGFNDKFNQAIITYNRTL